MPTNKYPGGTIVMYQGKKWKVTRASRSSGLLFIVCQENDYSIANVRIGDKLLVMPYELDKTTKDEKSEIKTTV